MTDKEKLDIALKALRDIANCDEENLVRYCFKVDGIALEALVQIEAADD